MRRLLLVLVLLVAACGGGGSGDDDVADVSGGSAPKATLGIITTEIETALGKAPFAEATEGQQLDVGDRVRTDTTGFAEITYHDGSWQRVEAEATLTILALTADDSVNTVRTGHDIGRTWNNVQELDDPDDTYEVRTPVATAAVRGTRFATDCPTQDNCTFTVLDGTIRLTPTTGDPLTLTAGQALTITDDGPRGDPTDADTDDPWITKNQDLDDARNGDDDQVAEDAGPTCVGLTVDDVAEATNQTMQLQNGRENPEGVSLCTWVSADSRHQVSMTVTPCSSLEDRALAPPREAVDLGEAGAWYPEQDVLVAYLGGRCYQLDQATAGEPDLTREEAVDLLRLALERVTGGPAPLPSAVGQ